MPEESRGEEEAVEDDEEEELWTLIITSATSRAVETQPTQTAPRAKVLGTKPDGIDTAGSASTPAPSAFPDTNAIDASGHV